MLKTLDTTKGAIHVDSKIGMGTTFTITLPTLGIKGNELLSKFGVSNH
jgi:signal transduction histidine kinase